MYLRITNTPKGQYLTICEKYSDRTTGKRKDIYVRKIGYASEYASQYSDPIAHFREVAAQMTADKGNDSSRSILIDLNDTMDVNEDSLRNVGYSVFKRLYLELELPAFWCKVTRGMNIEYDADGIFQMLVYSRILFPASKKKSYEQMGKFFESFGDFSMDDVYSALTIFGGNERKLQKWIYDHSVTKYHRDLETVYFDCTNYYYDISKPDIDDLDDEGNIALKRYRKYGPEKNHRKRLIQGELIS